MKLQSLTLLFIFQFGSWAHGQSNIAPKKITFSDLPTLVREKNEKVRASEIAVSAAQMRTGYLHRSFLPGLNLKAGSESATLGSASAEQRNFWGAEATMNIYRGGRDKLEEKIRESKTTQLQAESDRDYHTELRDARKTYWRLVANKNNLVELETALKDNEQNIQSAKRRSGAGVATNADAVQFELEKTLIIQQIKKLRVEQDALSNRLAIAIAYDDHENMELNDSFAHPPESLPVTSNSDTQNPDIKILEQEHQSHSLKKDQTGRWWIPSLDIYTTYRRPSFLESDTRALAKENEWVSGIQLSMSIGQGLEDYATKRAQELEIQSTSQKLAYAKRFADATEHDLTHDLKLIHELIHAADNDVERAANFLKLTKTEYSRGVKNGPDLQDAFSKFYEFKNRRTELYRLFYEAEADLNYLIGSK
ncbi:TolC family protein [Bdellovibrio sp. GT3]|uniref:TolC family protein n=1 Tax=Bdellovibrio sp. GT3 TaxID=3136282 RepID=UPI0030F0BEF5